MGTFSCCKPFDDVSKKLQPHGCYSIDKLKQLKAYTDDASSWRLLSISLLTSLPCVGLATLVESVPLASPEAGPYKNFTFWIRAWLVAYFVDYSAMIQISQCLARLKMEHHYIVAIAFVGSISSFLVVFSVAVWVAFPVPFSMLVASPPSVVVTVVGFGYVWGHRWKADPGLRDDLARHMMVFMWQVALTFIYPLYIFGFNSLTGIAQTVFVLMLPTIKAVGEAWISYTLGDQNDNKPEIVIFNVEVFNALYVSCAVQNSTSPSTTAALMLVDVLQFWFAMTGTMGGLSKVKELMAKIPPEHPLASENFVEIALRLLEISNRGGMNNQFRIRASNRKKDILHLKAAPTSLQGNRVSMLRPSTRAEVLCVERSSRFREHMLRSVTPKASRVHPLSPAQASMRKAVSGYPGSTNVLKFVGACHGLEKIFTRKERAAFIKTTTRVLYITEYIILVEYTEAVLPMVYALYLVIAFHVPNKIYIQSFDGLSSEQLYTNAGLVLAYSLLELTSLIIAMAVLKRTLEISSLHQLGFVLEMQAMMIQSKLMLWFVYIMQVPLVHALTSVLSLSGLTRLDLTFDIFGVRDAQKAAEVRNECEERFALATKTHSKFVQHCQPSSMNVAADMPLRT